MARTRVVVTAGALACALVVGTAAPATSGDAGVTWEQVRVALAAARSRAHDEPAPPAHDEPTAATVTVTVTIPDLSWAIDDPSARPGVRRAACHQVTGLDDEAAVPLAACLAHVGLLPALVGPLSAPPRERFISPLQKSH